MEWLERLRLLKDKTNETYKSIAQKTNIPQTTIEKIFSGRTKDPKLNMMRSIIHCLGFTLDDLVEETPNNKFILKDVEQRLIEDYRELSPQGQEYILQTMNMATSTYKKDNSTTDSEKSVG